MLHQRQVFRALAPRCVSTGTTDAQQPAPASPTGLPIALDYPQPLLSVRQFNLRGKILFHRRFAYLRVEVLEGRFLVRRALPSATGEYLPQPLIACPLPGARLLEVRLVLRRDGLDPAVPANRHTRLKCCREPSPFLLRSSASSEFGNAP